MTSNSSSNVVGVHYRVGKKIGEGSFGVIFEGTNLLNNQQVAIKFVRFRCVHSETIANVRLTLIQGTAKERRTTAQGRVPNLQNSRGMP